MKEASKFPWHYRLSNDHKSLIAGNTYASAGDVVGHVEGCEYTSHDPARKSDELTIYEDETGERFSCPADLLQRVPNTVPLQRKYLDSKRRWRTT